jgi:TolB protein
MIINLTRRTTIKQAAALAGIGLASSVARAQLRVEVSGVGATQLPISVAPFKGEEASPQKMSVIIAADLVRSGIFRAVEGSVGLDETSRLEWSRVRATGADTLVAGSVSRLADGRFDVRCRLWDAVRGTELGVQALLSTNSDLRYTAHRLADWIYEKLTGEKGVATTRIAYVTKTGGSSAPRFTLWVADADGEGANTALSSAEPIISPAWSPNGGQLAYVSFESRKPVVYAHEVATGRRRVVANFKGSNSAPAWAPNGQNLVVTLSRDGGSQIFLVSASGTGEPRRLSTSSSIDTEAVFAPDGQNIYFVSDRGGSPQIYRISVNGGTAQRITFSGNYNISPAISPDGAKLAFITRTGGAFKLMLQDLASNTVTPLTDTSADESPSFSANSKQIIYATQTQPGGRWQEALMTTTLDGRVKSRLTAGQGDIREPDWGAFQNAPLK